MIRARPRFEPIWITACTGISAAGGSSEAKKASSMMPPPMPKATVMKDAVKLAASRIIVAVNDRSGGSQLMGPLPATHREVPGRGVAAPHGGGQGGAGKAGRLTTARVSADLRRAGGRARMRTWFSEDHRLHFPQGELSGGELVTPYERPSRVEHVLRRLKERGFEAPRAPRPVGHGSRSARCTRPTTSASSKPCGTNGSRPGCGGEAIAGNYPARRMQTTRPPRNVDGRVGYYALASETAITAGTWRAALSSAASAQAAARDVAEGARGAFALCRPPGHHASRDQFGGYCFLNNAAVAAEVLRAAGAGRVAVLDIDFHHGNGTQDIFWERGDVFFASLHGAPEDAFPYFLGYADETGAGAGEGATANWPMPPGTGWGPWSGALDDALGRIAAVRGRGAGRLARRRCVRGRPDQLLQADLGRLPARGRADRPGRAAHRLLPRGRLRDRGGRRERREHARGVRGRRIAPRAHA